MQVWRLCRAVHAAGALTGEGARRFGGRWNSRSVPMVYCSTSLALAAVELFVHMEPALAPDDLVAIQVDLPDGEPARTLAAKDLPKEWWADEAATRALGDKWAREGATLGLRVPSVPIRSEWNVVLNPLHLRMAEVKVGKPEAFVFDERMFGKKR